MAKRILNEHQIENIVYKIVKESLESISNYYNFENKDSDNEDSDDSDKKRQSRRMKQVESYFKQPGVNPAQYAYKLYNVKPIEGNDTNDMKNARSKFMKCLNHEKNQEGYEYSFNSSEVNTLYSMISGNQLK